MMHYTNNLLPDFVKDGIQDDVHLLQSMKNNIAEMNQMLKELLDIPTSLLNRVDKSIHIYLKLKYEIPSDFRLEILNTFMSAYRHQELSFQSKGKIILTSNMLLKKKHTRVNFIFNDWRLFYNEAKDIIMRNKNSNNTANHNVLSSIVDNIINFVHDSRQYIPSTDIPLIIEEAHNLLEDSHNLQSIEGVLLLLNALPTNYDKYDDVLPHWIEIWKRIAFNSHWDACWLTLFCRARKHTHTYDWSQLNALFQSKARELMSLPAIGGQIPKTGRYPLTFPTFWKHGKHGSIDFLRSPECFEQVYVSWCVLFPNV